MKVLSWNLAAAFGRWRDDPTLHDRAWHWIAAVDPDLAFLQEVRPPIWANDRWQVISLPYQFFASAIVGKPELVISPIALPAGGALERFGSYLSTAELRLEGGTKLVIASAHTSARPAVEAGYSGLDGTQIARATVGEPWWNDVAFAGYRELVFDRRFMIAGDWNTARYVDGAGIPNAEGAEFFDRATAAGWIDISLDPERREGRTWYGRSGPRAYQPDHAFCDPTTAKLIRSFSIEPWPVTALDLSDHAPLLFEVDLENAVDRAAGGTAAPRDGAYDVH